MAIMRTTLFAQSLSVAEQIEVFSQAKMIEIHSSHWESPALGCMTWVMGQQYGQIIGLTKVFKRIQCRITVVTSLPTVLVAGSVRDPKKQTLFKRDCII